MSFHERKEETIIQHNLNDSLNPFHPTGPFLYPQKTSENLSFCDVFMGYIERDQ